eukprot:6470868-Amphidinium_carterae.1
MVEELGSVQPASCKRRGGGGAYRAFIHVQSKRQKMTKESMIELNREYRTMSEEQLQFYKDLGKQATALHGSGESSFPMNSATALRRAGASSAGERAKHAQHLEHSLALPKEMLDKVLEGEVPDVLPRVLNNADVDMLVRDVARDLRAKRKTREEEIANMEDTLLRDFHTKGKEFLQSRAVLANTAKSDWLGIPHWTGCEAFAAVHTPASMTTQDIAHVGSIPQLSAAWVQRHSGVRASACQCLDSSADAAA